MSERSERTGRLSSRFVSRGPGDERMGQGGVYREIVPDERLVYTELFDDQSYPGESLITIDFAERDGVTTLTTRVEFATPYGRDTVLGYPMARGVGESFDRLTALLKAALTEAALTEAALTEEEDGTDELDS